MWDLCWGQEGWDRIGRSVVTISFTTVAKATTVQENSVQVFWFSVELEKRWLISIPVDERLCTLRIRGNFLNYTPINVYAPTEEKVNEDKEVFFEKLVEAYDRAPTRDIKIIHGDFNAKVGREVYYRQIWPPWNIQWQWDTRKWFCCIKE